MIKRILIVSYFFLFACEGGMLTPGVGETDKFTSLTEKMNNDVRLKESALQQLQTNTNFVDFKVTGVTSIDQISDNEADVSFPEYSIATRFEKTEVIIVEGLFSDDRGDFFRRPITYLLGTNDTYYSESELSIDKLLVVIEYPLLDNWRLPLIINYFHNPLVFVYTGSQNNIEQTQGGFSFKFNQYQFNVTQNNREYFDSTIGSGRISATKIGQFPDFR